MKSNDRAGTDELFEKLFQQYEKPILRFVYRMVQDREVAEELTQQAFVKAYEALPRQNDLSNHRAWLYRIAANTCFDHLRRRKLVQWLPLMDRDSPHGGPDNGDSDQVQRILRQMSPEDRAVLVLYSVEEYSTSEIGEMLGLSAGAVKIRLFRARERFRRLYDREG